MNLIMSALEKTFTDKKLHEIGGGPVGKVPVTFTPVMSRKKIPATIQQPADEDLSLDQRNHPDEQEFLRSFRAERAGLEETFD
jgi:hypothetical protein